MATIIPSGSRARATARFFDGDLVLADPDTVTAEVRPPEGAPTTYTYEVDPELTRIALGVFRLEVDVDDLGRWEVTFDGDGAVDAAAETEFDVA